MIRVLTPVAIALFFICYPPFHRLRSPKVVLVLKRLIYRVLSVQPSPTPWTATRSSPRKPAFAKSVVGCNPCAEERSGLCGLEVIRNGRDTTRFGDDHFRVPSSGYSRYHTFLTIHDVSAPSG